MHTNHSNSFPASVPSEEPVYAPGPDTDPETAVHPDAADEPGRAPEPAEPDFEYEVRVLAGYCPDDEDYQFV